MQRELNEMDTDELVVHLAGLRESYRVGGDQGAGGATLQAIARQISDCVNELGRRS